MGALALVWVAVVSVPSAQAQASDPVGEWRAFGADPTNTKYSPLDQITADNFTDLEIAWRWTSISTEVTSPRPDIRPAQFKTTPLMEGGLVYASTALGQMATVDAGTGELVWSFDPQTYDRLDRSAHMGWQHRGVTIPQADESRW